MHTPWQDYFSLFLSCTQPNLSQTHTCKSLPCQYTGEYTNARKHTCMNTTNNLSEHSKLSLLWLNLSIRVNCSVRNLKLIFEQQTLKWAKYSSDSSPNIRITILSLTSSRFLTSFNEDSLFLVQPEILSRIQQSSPVLLQSCVQTSLNCWVSFPFYVQNNVSCPSDRSYVCSIWTVSCPPLACSQLSTNLSKYVVGCRFKKDNNICST